MSLVRDLTTVEHGVIPTPSLPDPLMLTPLSEQSIGTFLAARGAAWGTSAGWPAADRALFFPFFVREFFVAVKGFVMNGGTVAGNLDIGIYDEAFTRLVSSGTTAQSGTSVLQELDLTDTTLRRGRYYLALWGSSASSLIFRSNTPSANELAVHGAMQQSSLASGLPSTATPVRITSGYAPLAGLSQRTLVA